MNAPVAYHADRTRATQVGDVVTGYWGHEKTEGERVIVRIVSSDEHMVTSIVDGPRTPFSQAPTKMLRFIRTITREECVRLNLPMHLASSGPTPRAGPRPWWECARARRI